PHILDGDDGLVGEGLEKLDLSLREPADLTFEDSDRPDRLAIAKHRHRQNASEACRAGLISQSVLAAVLNVRDVNDASCQACAGRGCAPTGWSRMRTPEGVRALRTHVGESG